MNSITITVAEVRAPAPGKKQASVIDSTSRRWGINASDMGNYRQSGTYEVTKFKESYYQGKTYYTIEEARPVNGPTLIKATPDYAPRPQPPSDDQRRMDIFVCGAFNNMMANPNIKPFEMVSGDFEALVLTLKKVWKKTLGPQAQETLARGSLDNDMNDSVDF